MPKLTPVLTSTDSRERIRFSPPSLTSHPPVDIAIARRPTTTPAPRSSTPAIDLSGRPTITMLIGRGGTGKTTLARYLIGRTTRPTLTAALDPVNRTLANYVDGVSQPETSDPARSARWLQDFLEFAIAGQHPAVIDFGGGDTTLGKILEDSPDLAAMVEEAGMSLVALYTMAPRIDDLASFLSIGFQPAATAFVLNDIGDPSIDSDHDFSSILAQPAVRAATAAGAQVVWMPRLDSRVVSTIEQRRLSFADAGAGAQGLGPFAAATVRVWLRQMDTALEGVQSWLP